MSQLTAYKCDICKFTTHSKKDVDVTGWASISYVVRLRLPQASIAPYVLPHIREANMKERARRDALRDKIVNHLGGRMHVCPGCIQLFEGGKLNLKMVAGPVEERVG